MTYQIANMTANRAQKVKEAFDYLGQPGTADITSANRAACKRFLSGLGLPSKWYESATLAQLNSVYNGMHPDTDTPYEALYTLMRPYYGDTYEAASDAVFAAARAYRNAPDFWQNACVAETTSPADMFGIGDADNGDNQPRKDKHPEPTEPTKIEDNKTMPDNTPTPTPSGDLTAKEAKAAEAMATLLETLGALGATGDAPSLDEKRVVELIREHMPVTRLEIKIDGKDKVLPELHHKQMPTILLAAQTGTPVMMVGPAGSGKTTIAEQVAKALDLPFYFNGALSSEYKLTGFVAPGTGETVRTPFREAYEHGGVYLFDEIDGSMPDALLAFNAALSNGHADFPDGTVQMHKDFRCLAAANTYGRGADRVYVGRSQLDGASLDRFILIDLDYDEKLEKTLTGNDDWADYVQRVRAVIEKQSIRHIVSPRASIAGAKLLAAGLSRTDVENATVWKGLDKDSKRKIKAAM